MWIVSLYLLLLLFWSRKPSTSNFTRAVYGVCVDPWLDHRLASHHDNNVVIWDTRNFDRPIVTLQQPQTVAKLAWWDPRESFIILSLCFFRTFWGSRKNLFFWGNLEKILLKKLMEHQKTVVNICKFWHFEETNWETLF